MSPLPLKSVSETWRAATTSGKLLLLHLLTCGLETKHSILHSSRRRLPLVRTYLLTSSCIKTKLKIKTPGDGKFLKIHNLSVRLFPVPWRLSAASWSTLLDYLDRLIFPCHRLYWCRQLLRFYVQTFIC